MRIQPGRRHIARGLAQHLDPPDRIDRETAQAVAQVAPGIEVPVVAVVNQALGRNGSDVDLVAPRFQASISMRWRSNKALAISVKKRGSMARLAIDSSLTR